jgi:hypothetical protein
MISIWKKMKSRKFGKPYYKNMSTNESESKWNVPNKNGILREVKESNNTFIIYIPYVYLNKYNLDYSLEYAPKIDPSMVVPETSGSNTSQVQVAEHIIGFIVFFDIRLESGHYHHKGKEKIPYLNIEIDHVLARSDDENYFKEVPTLEHRHRLWQPSDNYVRLLKELSRGGFFCELHRDKFSRCGIEHTLFITEKADDGASAFLIQSLKKGNIVIDIDGIISGNIQRRLLSRQLTEFLTDPTKRQYTFFNDEGLIDIESIELNKTIVNSVSVISARIFYPYSLAETAIREIELSLRNSKTAFIDSIHMYYQNNCNRLGGPHNYCIYNNVEEHISDFEEISTDEELCSSYDGGILLCWIVLAYLSGAITYKEYLQLKNDIEKDITLLTKHDLDIKYIMIVLKKVLSNGNQNYRQQQELAKVKCIGLRKFVHTDLKLPFIEK